MDAFQSLKEEFNLDEAEAEVKNALVKADEKIAEVREGIKSQKYNLEDKEYIITELQDLIASDREVMSTLKDMITQGAGNPAMYAVYATLSKSVRENVTKLSDVEKEITDYQVIESNEEYREKVLASKERMAERKAITNSGGTTGQLTQNNTYIFTPAEQFEIMKNANVKPIEVEQPKFDLS